MPKLVEVRSEDGFCLTNPEWIEGLSAWKFEEKTAYAEFISSKR